MYQMSRREVMNICLLHNDYHCWILFEAIEAKMQMSIERGRMKRKHYSQSTVEVNTISSNFRGLIETPSARKFRIEFVSRMRLGDAMTTHTTTL